MAGPLAELRDAILVNCPSTKAARLPPDGPLRSEIIRGMDVEKSFSQIL